MNYRNIIPAKFTRAHRLTTRIIDTSLYEVLDNGFAERMSARLHNIEIFSSRINDGVEISFVDNGIPYRLTSRLSRRNYTKEEKPCSYAEFARPLLNEILLNSELSGGELKEYTSTMRIDLIQDLSAKAQGRRFFKNLAASARRLFSA